MDMNQFTSTHKDVSWKLRRHLKAIRENQIEVAEIFIFLSEFPPNVEGAYEVFNTLEQVDQIGLWSCSTKDGGVWERWQRDALKTGELTDAYRIWCERKGIPYRA